MVTVYEATMRYRKVGTRQSFELHSPESIFQFMRARAQQASPLEKLWIIGLDSSGRDVLVKVIAGWLDQVPINMRDIFSHLLLCQATSFVVCHNHPSGAIIPSNEDKSFTRSLSQVANHLRIRLLDHLILTPTQYFSFAESGLLPQ